MTDKRSKDETKRKQARARAREKEATRGPDEDVFSRWLDGIAAGQTERFAAIQVGVPYQRIRGWVERHHDLRERHLDAMERHIQRRLDESDDLPFAIGEASKTEDAAGSGIHPKAAELKLKQNQWRLGTLDPERFVQKTRNEHTGKDGGAMKTEVTITLAEARELAKEDT